MHSLDYNRIVLVLQKFNYSGEAHANIPPQPKMREGGKVILTVKEGQILSCLILDKLGRTVFYDRGVSPLLDKLGVLEWDLVHTSSSSSQRDTGPITPAPRGMTPPPKGMIQTSGDMAYMPRGITPPPRGMMHNTPGDMAYTPRGITPPPAGYINQASPYISRQPGKIQRNSFPRQKIVTPEQLRSWPILQRSVYMLCDGTHNYEQIATLLSRPLNEIERILDNLRRSNAIEE